MRQEGYYWCLLKYKHHEEWDILWCDSKGDWILDGGMVGFGSPQIIEIDEKQIKRE